MLTIVSSDEQAIIDLAIAYTWALDTKQLDDLRSVFATDATADLNGVHCDGLDAIIARIERPLSRLDATQHLVGNHQVTRRRRHGDAPLPPAEPARQAGTPRAATTS